MSKRKPPPVNSQASDGGRDRQRSQILGISIIALATLFLAAIRYYFNLG
jgi:hypothetical protein